MRKNFKSQLIVISAALLSAAFVQGCGSSSGSSTTTTTSSVSSCYNSLGQYICSEGVGSTQAQALYDACGSSAPIVVADQALGGAAEVQSVTGTTSPDGTTVCQITFLQDVNYEGARYYLGPAAGATASYAGNTSVLMEAYDQFAGVASGAYGASGCSDAISGSSSSTGSDLYGYVEGMGSYFPFDGSVESVPYDGEGYLYVGISQSEGESGCLEFQLQLDIQRCVDSNGNVHQCPSTLQPAI